MNTREANGLIEQEYWSCFYCGELDPMHHRPDRLYPDQDVLVCEGCVGRWSGGKGPDVGLRYCSDCSRVIPTEITECHECAWEAVSKAEMEKAHQDAKLVAQNWARSIPVPEGYQVLTEVVGFEYEDPYVRERAFGEYNLYRTFTDVETGLPVATCVIDRVECCEGVIYGEKWFDIEGQLHRDFGPAEHWFNSHSIPDEAHLDDGRNRYYEHGSLIYEEDIGYEIFLEQPNYVRAAYGEGF